MQPTEDRGSSDLGSFDEKCHPKTALVEGNVPVLGLLLLVRDRTRVFVDSMAPKKVNIERIRPEGRTILERKVSIAQTAMTMYVNWLNRKEELLETW